MRTFEVEDAVVPMLALAVAMAVHERRLVAMENVDSSSLASQQVRREIAQLEDFLSKLNAPLPALHTLLAQEEQRAVSSIGQ